MTDTITTKVLPRKCFGTVLTTPTVAAEVPPSVIMRLLDRHFTNDWGDLPHGDELINSETVNDCEGRVMSSYSWPGLDQKIWIISYLQSDPELQQDQECCNTTVLFASEY